MAPTFTQVEAAQRMYDRRAANYEKSWHGEYTERIMKIINIAAGSHVLVVCCGTGLDAFAAARDVGPEGRIFGVDVSTGMLGEARARQGQDTELGQRLEFLEHNVADLDSCEGLRGKKGSFDYLICSNAFVLLDDPPATAASWAPWLKSGGQMVIDVPHEMNWPFGVVMEKVIKQMGRKWVSNRAWIKTKDSFKTVLDGIDGLKCERAETIDRVTGSPITIYTVDDADERFDALTKPAPSEGIAAMSFAWEDLDLEAARKLFKKEWAATAVNGKIEWVDELYLYIARRS